MFGTTSLHKTLLISKIIRETLSASTTQLFLYEAAK
jgi:hypothetical protein